MANEESLLNQDMNSTKTSFSPAHQHLQQDAPEAIVSTNSEGEKLDHLGMESARRAQNRVHKNEQRVPVDTIFSK